MMEKYSTGLLLFASFILMAWSGICLPMRRTPEQLAEETAQQFFMTGQPSANQNDTLIAKYVMASGPVLMGIGAYCTKTALDWHYSHDVCRFDGKPYLTVPEASFLTAGILCTSWGFGFLLLGVNRLCAKRCKEG